MIYLVSYNHSGNTWVRYCIEYVMKKPTWGHRAYSISERDINFLNIDLTADPIMIKRHVLDTSEISVKDTFILLLRHPAKCIKYDMDINNECIKYYNLIKAFNNHEGLKHVYYYDELFKKDSILKILKHFDNFSYSNALCDLFLCWDQHLEKCKNIYKNKTNKDGCDTILIPNHILEDEIVKQCQYI